MVAPQERSRQLLYPSFRGLTTEQWGDEAELIIEHWNETTALFEELARVTIDDGFTLIKMRNEFSGEPEWSARILPRDDLTAALMARLSHITLLTQRYERRTTDPPIYTNGHWQFRVQPMFAF